MTKAELIEELLKRKDVPELSKKAAGEIVNAVFSTLSKAIKKDRRFAYPGFGTFSLRKRKARTGHNPQTGEKIKIAAAKTVTFKPSPQFKKTL